MEHGLDVGVYEGFIEQLVAVAVFVDAGKERFTIALNNGKLVPGSIIRVKTDCGKSFETKCRIDTDVEVEYFRNGGALHYVLRNILNRNSS